MLLLNLTKCPSKPTQSCHPDTTHNASLPLANSYDINTERSSVLASSPLIPSFLPLPEPLWNYIITDSTDIGFRTEQMVLIGMRSLRVRQWLAYLGPGQKQFVILLYLCLCPGDRARERKTSGEGEKERERAEEEREALYQFLASLCITSFLSPRLKAYKTSTRLFFCKAIEQRPDMNKKHCELCLPISSSPSSEDQRRVR